MSEYTDYPHTVDRAIQKADALILLMDSGLTGCPDHLAATLSELRETIEIGERLGFGVDGLIFRLGKLDYLNETLTVRWA